MRGLELSRMRKKLPFTVEKTSFSVFEAPSPNQKIETCGFIPSFSLKFSKLVGNSLEYQILVSPPIVCDKRLSWKKISLMKFSHQTLHLAKHALVHVLITYLHKDEPLSQASHVQ